MNGILQDAIILAANTMDYWVPYAVFGLLALVLGLVWWVFE